ncbi:hypothetical protein DESC_850021 [Desulfosarcina cetonica]|nr:hypothetical protein DESC_850021 [Desulfosarcina cetonica]
MGMTKKGPGAVTRAFIMAERRATAYFRPVPDNDLTPMVLIS